jgi:hypothetical protein
MSHFLFVLTSLLSSLFSMFHLDIKNELGRELVEYGPSKNAISVLSEEINEYSSKSGLDPEVIIYSVVDLLDIIIDMKPGFLEGKEGGIDRAVDISWLIYRESHRNNINQYVAAVVAFRESKFSLVTERGYTITKRGYKNYNCVGCHGSLGERGLFQIYPYGAAHKQGGRCDLFNRECNIKTGISWLARCRDVSKRIYGKRSTTATWVAAYGRRKMLPPKLAERAPEVKRAKSILCSTFPQCQDIWR